MKQAVFLFEPEVEDRPRGNGEWPGHRLVGRRRPRCDLVLFQSMVDLGQRLGQLLFVDR